MPRLPAPAATLPAEPVIGSDADVDTGLAELGYYAAAEKRLKAEADAKIARIIEQFDASLVVTIDGKPVAFADRRRAVEAAIERYATAHRERLTADGGKTVRFNHGTIAWRQTPPRFDYADPKQRKQAVLARLDKLVGLFAAVASLLERIAVFGAGRDRCRLGDIITLKPDVSLTAIKAAHEKGRLSKADARKIGLVYVERGEAFQIKPNDQPLESHSAQ